MEAKQPTFFGHPRGLFYLFFTEMWERFSYYGMRAILVLYLTSKTTDANPGLGWSNTEAFALYGWYTMLVYLASIPGGIIADKIFGQRRTVLYGGILLCIGHVILAVEHLWAFYTGLGFIILGVGGLKPNISTMVGGLYRDGDLRRDKGFTIFYMGINLGALLSSIIVGTVGEILGWHYGFGLAGICMIFGLIMYTSGRKYLEGVGEVVQTTETHDSNDSIGFLINKLFRSKLPLVVTMLLVGVSFYVFYTSGYGYGLLSLFLSLIVGVMMVIYSRLDPQEKDRFSVLLISFAIVIVFWGAFEQAGGLMNKYTQEKIDRSFFGLVEVPTSWFQGANAGFIIIFGALVAAFWVWRKRKKKESSSIFKMAMGTIVMGLGFLFMAKASMEAQAEPFGKGLMIWVLLAYLFHTLGELCASPVAMSFITKLAPRQYVAIMMGVYFAATGLGNKVAGVIGEGSQVEAIETQVFIEQPIDATSFNKKALIQLNDDMTDLQILAYSSENESEDEVKMNVEDVDMKLSTEDKRRIIDAVSASDTDGKGYAIVDFKKETKNEKNYDATFRIMEEENPKEFKTFMGIVGFTSLFGILLLLFLRKLKKLTHGIEEREK